MQGVNVKSEIGNLKKVILHRPGDELLNLTPNTLEELLFDDIPFLPVAQEEHDAFANILRGEGVEVVYLEDLMAEVLDAKPELRQQFLDQWIYEAGIRTDMYHDIITDYINSNYAGTKEMVMKTMAGINLQELPQKDTHLLVDMVSDRCKLVCAPMPNLYFTRDPFAMIGNGVSINRMYSVTRNRETIYGDYIFKYHPDFAGTPTYYDRNDTFHIEGGDILNINEHVLAIGISQRTEPDAIDAIAHNVFNDETSTIDTILAFNIPSSRAFMHLDTVFTQIDYDKFTIHPGIMGPLGVRDHPGRQGRHEDPRAQRGSGEGALRVRRPAGEAHPPAAAATASRPSASSGTTAPTRSASVPAPWWSISATTSPTTCCTSRASTAWRCPRPSSPAAVAARAACPCRPGARLCKPQGARSVKELSYVRLFRPSLASQRWAVKARFPVLGGPARNKCLLSRGKGNRTCLSISAVVRSACAPAPWWCTSATTSPTTCCTRTASTAWSCRRPSSPAAVAARAACPCRPGARRCKATHRAA